MANNISITRYVCEDAVVVESGCKDKCNGLPSELMRRKVKELRKDKQTLINLFLMNINASNVKSGLPKRLNSMFGGEGNISDWDDIVFMFGMVSTLAEKYKYSCHIHSDLINTISSYLEITFEMCDWFKRNGGWYTFCLQNYKIEDQDKCLIDMIKYPNLEFV
jgi:hypothetical protein